MPSIAQVTLSGLSPLSKSKRKREEGGGHNEEKMKLFEQAGIGTMSESSSSVNNPQRARTLETASIFSVELREEPHYVERRPIHLKPRRLHDSKRQRVFVDPQYSFEDETHFTSESRHNMGSCLEQQRADRIETKTTPKIDLNPCHICYRKPTAKSELDQYANCEGCGRRTCYICIRECLGSIGTASLRDYDMAGCYDELAFSFHGEEEFVGDGKMTNGRQRMDNGDGGLDENEDKRVWEKGRIKEHKEMICSGCCVERGTEGEVWCLGCLRSEHER